MMHMPRNLKMGGFALAALALASALLSPMTAVAQGPTTTPTAAATVAATTETTAESTAAPTQAAEPTRLPPCPLPNGGAAQTASATDAATPDANATATGVATADVTAEATSAATEPPPFEPGYLGVAGEDVDSCGTRVVDLLEGSPAAIAGVQVGDIITGVGVTAYPGVLALREYITAQPVGAEIDLVVRRDGAELILPVTLGARPPEIPPTVTATASS